MTSISASQLVWMMAVGRRRCARVECMRDRVCLGPGSLRRVFPLCNRGCGWCIFDIIYYGRTKKALCHMDNRIQGKCKFTTNTQQRKGQSVCAREKKGH